MENLRGLKTEYERLSAAIQDSCPLIIMPSQSPTCSGFFLPDSQRCLKDEHRVIDQITFRVRQRLARQEVPLNRRAVQDELGPCALE